MRDRNPSMKSNTSAQIGDIENDALRRERFGLQKEVMKDSIKQASFPYKEYIPDEVDTLRLKPGARLDSLEAISTIAMMEARHEVYKIKRYVSMHPELKLYFVEDTAAGTTSLKVVQQIKMQDGTIGEVPVRLPDHVYNDTPGIHQAISILLSEIASETTEDTMQIALLGERQQIEAPPETEDVRKEAPK